MCQVAFKLLDPMTFALCAGQAYDAKCFANRYGFEDAAAFVSTTMPLAGSCGEKVAANGWGSAEEFSQFVICLWTNGCAKMPFGANDNCAGVSYRMTAKYFAHLAHG